MLSPELTAMMEKAGMVQVGGDRREMDFDGFVRMMALWVQELDPS